MKKDKINYAIKLASVLHEKHYRKTDNTPYISHPYAVGLILSMADCEEEIIIAGILHDVVEDTDIGIDEIREKFGNRVAEIIHLCTEYDKTLPWEIRKKEVVKKLESAPIEVKYVKLADVLHNLKSIYESMAEMKDDIWINFNAGKEKQKWYYSEIIKILFEENCNESYSLMYNELKLYYELVFES